MEKFADIFLYQTKSEVEFFDFIKNVKKEWIETPVDQVFYQPLAWLADNQIAETVSAEALLDARQSDSMAAKINGKYYPVRFEVARKTLLERNRMTGKAMSDMESGPRCMCLNTAARLYPKDMVKILIQEDKASAFLSGGEKDYAILDAFDLINSVKKTLDDRFGGGVFVSGYFDHTRTAAEWKMPARRKELIGAYLDMLRMIGKSELADKLVPGIKFSTSDVGIGKAAVSAYLYGGPVPICIGSCMEVKHRSGATLEDFENEISGMFAKFVNTVKEIERLHGIELRYPVNVMTAVCKKLLLPKKESMEAIDMFKDIFGVAPATAGDIYLSMQEILFSLKSEQPMKQFTFEENIAKALTKKIRWEDYDRPGEVKW